MPEGLMLLENDRKLIDEQAEKARQQFDSSLSAYINSVWERNKRAKINIERQMTYDLNQRGSEYDSFLLGLIKKTEGSEIFTGLTSIKCRAAEAWLTEAYAMVKGNPWVLTPTPLPDLDKDKVMEVNQQVLSTIYNAAMIYQQETGMRITPEEFNNVANQHREELHDKTLKEIKRLAKDAMNRMTDKIEDQLDEGKFYKQFKKMRSFLVTLGIGILKGPTVRRPRRLKHVKNPYGGNWTHQFTREPLVEFDSVNPLDFYPEADALDIDDGDIIERLRLHRQDLNDMLGVDGYNDTFLRAVLNDYEDGLKEQLSPDTDRGYAESRGPVNYNDSRKIEVLNFWGAVKGKLLLEWGMSKEQIPDADLDYDINAWLIGKYVVRVIINETGIKPYSKACFEEIPGSFWGKSLPNVLSDMQDMCNAAARAIQNNAAFASGPMSEWDMAKLPFGAKGKIWPWRVIETDANSMKEGPAVRFYQPKSMIAELMALYTNFSREADEKCGIPSFAHGDPKVGGAGNALANYEKILTPSGLKEIGSIKKGDLVVNSYGSFSKVTGVFSQGESDIYRLKFSNGEYVDCDMEHRWSVRTHNDRKFRTLTTAEIISKGLFRKQKIGWRSPSGQRAKWMIPLIGFVEFEQREVKIDPYTMGALIGDGDARCRITGMDKEIFDRIPYPLGKPDHRWEKGKAWSQVIIGKKKDYLSYGLNCKSIDKFIPEDYLFNTKEVRLELLRGLLDTDGCCSKQGEVYFQTSSYRLAKDFINLIRSLGAITNGIIKYESAYRDFGRGKCFCKESYRIVFNLSWEKIFHLSRKQKRVRVIPKTHIFITGIELLGTFPATCIEVDSKNKLFICENFIPTHNTSSGYAMFMQAAGKIISNLVDEIDKGIIVPLIKRMYIYNMVYDPDELLKGDADIDVKGVSAVIVKEQEEMKKSEFLRDTNNPTDMAIIGLLGRKELLKERVKSFGWDVDKIIPEQQNFFPMQNVKGVVPAEKPETLDVAGQPSGGTQYNQFNSVSQRGGR